MQVSYTKYGIGIGSQSLRAKTKNTENHAPRVYTHTQDSALLNSTVSLDRNRSWLPVTASVLSSNCSNCAQFQVLRVQRHGCGKEDQHQVQQSRHRESERSKFPNVSSLFWGEFFMVILIWKEFFNDFSRLPRVFSSEKQACEKTTSALSSETGHGWTSQIVLPSVTYVSVYQSF